MAIIMSGPGLPKDYSVSSLSLFQQLSTHYTLLSESSHYLWKYFSSYQQGGRDLECASTTERRNHLLCTRIFTRRKGEDNDLCVQKQRPGTRGVLQAHVASRVFQNRIFTGLLVMNNPRKTPSCPENSPSWLTM
uniref:Uncharacterized protein n=1 Tax=Sphaerodactylus townsendi TaxID=933632 RepID=A0ACB8G044_9SAUR